MKQDWIPIAIAAVVGAIAIYIVIKLLGVIVHHPVWTVLIVAGVFLCFIVVRRNQL